MLLVLVGSASLASACSSDPSATGSNPSNNGTPTAGNTSATTAGTSSFAGTNGNPGAGGTTGAAGSGVNNTSGAGVVGGTTSTAGAATTGGAPGTAGTTGTAGTGGTVDPGTGPAGYLTEKDWHGCSWTGKGDLGATTIMPQDFTAKPPADPFCVSGKVGGEPDYKSVALLGFNVNEAPPATCAYKAADPNADGPPSVVPTAEGIAVNFVKRGTNTAFKLRVQIQGPNGAKPDPVGAMDRWCANITEVQGKIFVPWSSFTPSCWVMAPDDPGTPYAKQPISAIVFSVPGELTDVPFDFCVNGFVQGTSPADAPDGPAVAGDQKGTVGTNVSPDGDFARAKVIVDGENYIVQNNNWGNPSGTDLILNYTNNSFKIASGSGSGASAPASFPSIYIGANGNTANGVYSTKTTDNLPIQISAITSLPSTFRYSGSTGLFNAAYDIWFANSPPTTEYKDGIDGFVMIWLRDPHDKVPIGSKMNDQPIKIANQDWNVWVGPRGDGPAGYNDAPVVSFVNTVEDMDNRAQSFKDVNLKEFFMAAAGYGIPSTMYLTDVFAGFEIWQGGAGGNLGVDEFKAVVNK
jgi:hypothetical protein